MDGGILLPQQAVTRGPQADTVMVVDDKGMVAPRQVKLGGAKGTNWVVLGGLKTGEQVMVDGFQKMMNPKAPVKAVPWQQPSAQAGGIQSQDSSSLNINSRLSRAKAGRCSVQGRCRGDLCWAGQEACLQA